MTTPNNRIENEDFGQEKAELANDYMAHCEAKAEESSPEKDAAFQAYLKALKGGA